MQYPQQNSNHYQLLSPHFHPHSPPQPSYPTPSSSSKTAHTIPNHPLSSPPIPSLFLSHSPPCASPRTPPLSPPTSPASRPNSILSQTLERESPRNLKRHRLCVKCE
ncbi:hypothetical protein JHK82_021392 [Glycine max]|nr:hypothetical protein JHK87_021305 [Glycine soja]KAG5136661.1 hypothetical protein JHK82_021392 [Glycine max]